MYSKEGKDRYIMNFRKKDKRTLLEKEIDSVLKRMAETDEISGEYRVLVSYLETLYKARETTREPKKRISPDTWLIVGANLVGIILVLRFEKIDSITSKAVQFIIKGRV